MTSLRNPLLLAVCLLLLANLLFNNPQRSGMPHPRPQGFRSSNESPSSRTLIGDGGDRESSAELGQMLYGSNCTACHGPRGYGVPRQGANLRESKFIAELSDDELVAFLKQGRTPADPRSTMGMLMPARGGNRALDNAALADVVTFLRELQEEARQNAGAAAAADLRNTQ
jgi:mono/diheme cytochrome c family protein